MGLLGAPPPPPFSPPSPVLKASRFAVSSRLRLLGALQGAGGLEVAALGGLGLEQQGLLELGPEASDGNPLTHAHKKRI